MSIPARISDDLPFLTALRRDLHAYPELGFEEERTAGIVATLLEEAGIAVHRGLGGSGVVGTLQIGNGTRRIGLRADMDALAMPETAERSYKSTVPGKMHACGHDGHTAMLLGAARHLAATRDFSGTVHFIFQPAEEGRGGARRMVEEGLFTLFPCDAVYGLHNMPGLAVDEIAVVEGPQLASSDSWRMTFRGAGTHGAKPHLGRDPITAAGTFLSSLQTIVGRVVDPLQPAVVSACFLQAGDPKALNVIPDIVEIGGTARAYSPDVRDQLETEIGRLAHGTAAMYSIAVDYAFERRIPPVINDADATARALAVAGSVFGGKVQTSFPPSMAGDDFAFFAQNAPGCYVWLGNGPAVDGALHHNTAYDFNDEALGYGAAYWVALVERELKV
ncbi:M20 aminoacylase family protein [Rhizobium leguminosarum]|uniref:Amidohydrolase n=1 Tax=Rhizobium leguminosarum bv. trifolii (strain WSM1325) TaxID=395491 RepID=C6AVA5_RHILS|nr:M20 aminoacylase family protein [Rhizobium leguminosarum]ACS57702.1 amidohydrolase [Rhizobium leguminosarum bv. trifolii WSM1325]MBY2906601.1 amidohydrolase [Rhizobium leguminosarum]MBY2947349.1 amidohydrolase [Rhizobium leguminosarum]MBY2965372.1 amidohydrolase [Rhizobium leguminosarum]RWY74699.1 amidohydrolase [Rhizobium leguminosarum]